MSELAACFLGAALAGFIVAYAAYTWGYVKGYSDGLDYGRKGLEEYHRHTMKNLRSLS